MKETALIVFLAFLGGCVGYRISHVTGTISGSNIVTPYGPANGNLIYDATTCLGNCPKASEIINGYSGSTDNTAK